MKENRKLFVVRGLKLVLAVINCILFALVAMVVASERLFSVDQLHHSWLEHGRLSVNGD